jgi:osmotically-inducible protein OsmY
MTSMRLIAALAALFALNACTSPTGLIDAATTPAEDRSFADSSADAQLKLTINKRFLDESGKLFIDVNTVVYEGRVLLTGKVENQAAYDTAERIVQQTPNVRETINELLINPERGFVSGVNDVAIEIKIKAQLIATKDIKSINYRWRSLDGTVYVIGAAQNSQELSSVVEVIRNIDGVRKVVNLVRVR